MTLFFLQALLGFLIGFYFTDKKQGLSFREIRFGVMIMMVVASFLIFQENGVSLHQIAVLMMGAIILFGSIFVGEYVHVQLIKFILRNIQKDSIHAKVSQFVLTAKKAAHQNGAGKEVVDSELYQTVTYLRSLAKQASCFNQKELVEQISTVTESCIALGRLSRQIDAGDARAYARYEHLADQLLDVSWQMLSRTEEKIHRDLSSNSWNTIAFAMKSSHIK